MGTQIETTEIPQSYDQTGMSEVYPLRDVAALDDDQTARLSEATRAAMRPLVEAEWAKRGYTVAWKSDPVMWLAADEDANHELRETEIAVWGFAYDALDDDAVWAQAGL